MGTVEAHIVSHYSHDSLRSALLEGLKAMGKGPETVTMNDLAAVDEFQMGGDAPEKVGNLIEGLECGCFAPVEPVARRA